MRADPHIVPLREPHGVRHDGGIRGVKATRDIGDGDMRHHAFIIAHFVETEAFAHVAVDREFDRVSFCRGHRLNS